MNKIIMKLSLLVISVAIFSSCGSTVNSRSARSISFEPDVVRLDMSFDKFVYVGDVEVSVDYRTYLAGIVKVDKVNGKPYAGGRNKDIVNFAGPKNISLAGPISKALYKVVDTYPDADYYVPTVSKKKTEKLFLGSSSSRTVTFKAYKFNK